MSQPLESLPPRPAGVPTLESEQEGGTPVFATLISLAFKRRRDSQSSCHQVPCISPPSRSPVVITSISSSLLSFTVDGTPELQHTSSSQPLIAG
ncbi:hypothetical protein AGIG_G6936 [Arapaima gigas]